MPGQVFGFTIAQLPKFHFCFTNSIRKMEDERQLKDDTLAVGGSERKKKRERMRNLYLLSQNFYVYDTFG